MYFISHLNCSLCWQEQYTCMNVVFMKCFRNSIIQLHSFLTTGCTVLVEMNSLSCHIWLAFQRRICTRNGPSAGRHGSISLQIWIPTQHICLKFSFLQPLPVKHQGLFVPASHSKVSSSDRLAAVASSDISEFVWLFANTDIQTLWLPLVSTKTKTQLWWYSISNHKVICTQPQRQPGLWSIEHLGLSVYLYKSNDYGLWLQTTLWSQGRTDELWYRRTP